MKTTFDFRDNARFQPGAKRDADAVGTRLAALQAKAGGELTPAAVVDDARDESSPLHSFFEWSDTVAAAEYRLQQARGLIRTVVAVYSDEAQADVAPLRVLAYSHIEGIGEPHYRTTVDALAEEATRKAVLQRALRDLQSWRKRYAELSELAKVFAASDEVEDLFRREG